MNILDLQKRLHDKSIHVDDNGHLTNNWLYMLDDIIQDLKQDLNSDDHAEVTQAKRRLFTPLPYKKLFPIGLMNSIKTYCFNCDKEVMPVLVDEDHLILNDSWENWYREYRDTEFDWRKEQIPEKHIHECSFNTIGETRMMTAQINIPSGNLIFANYFGPEELYEDSENEYKTGHRINAKIGRYRLMQYLAGKDVGYGQMSNTSAEIYVKDDGTEIILGPEYWYDEDWNEKKVNHKGFTHAGRVSCVVWRWQCADKAILDKHIGALINNGEEIEHTSVNVQPGKWKIEHYYDFMTRKEEEAGQPYSRLIRIND